MPVYSYTVEYRNRGGSGTAYTSSTAPTLTRAVRLLRPIRPRRNSFLYGSGEMVPTRLTRHRSGPTQHHEHKDETVVLWQKDEPVGYEAIKSKLVAELSGRGLTMLREEE